MVVAATVGEAITGAGRGDFMGDDILKQAREIYGHLTIKDMVILNTYRLDKLEERVGQQNGRVRKLENWRSYTAGAVAVVVVAIGILAKALF